MQYKDTLTMYEELISTGMPEGQAKVAAHQWGEMGDTLGNAIYGIREDLKELKNDVKTQFIELKKDMFWVRIIGAALFAAMLTNGIFNIYFSK